MHIHFSYGSNMDVEAMRRRCPDARAIGKARLPGWAFFIAGSGYASLGRKRGAVTHGVLWRLGDADVVALDLYEDLAGGLYRKTTLAVDLNGRRLPAMVYLTVDARRGRPEPGYQDSVVEAARAWRLPGRAIRRLESWRPDQG